MKSTDNFYVEKTRRIIFDGVEINLYPSGAASIDTFIEIDDDDKCGYGEEVLRATFNVNSGFGDRYSELQWQYHGEVFSWVGFFIYKHESVIDIDPF